MKYSGMVTPKEVTHLENNDIFVFGSNLAGRHGKGAAKYALIWGARYGQGLGLAGRTYAIPTKTADVRSTLPLQIIKLYVDIFVDFAKRNPRMRFLVTEIGCGLAGLTPDAVAPLFAECVFLGNVCLPESFWDVLYKKSGGVK